MFQVNIAQAQGLAAELTMAEKSISAAKVILTGLVVVFAMLFLLILIIKLYSTIITAAQTAADKRARKKEKIVVQPIDADFSTIDTKPAYVSPPTVEDGIPEEVVAVIAAAVASACGPQSKAKIKSIKKSNGGRSAWANAGVLENTRPF